MSSVGKSVHDMDDDELDKFIDLTSEKIRDLECLYKQTLSGELCSFMRKIANINSILKGLNANSYTDDDIPLSLNMETIKKLILSEELFTKNSEKSAKELLNEIDTKLIPFMEKYSKVYTELLNEDFQANCELNGRIDREMDEELFAKAMNRDYGYIRL